MLCGSVSGRRLAFPYRALKDASEALDARVSGAGSVEYVGDPTVEQEVSGAGRVSKH